MTSKFLPVFAKNALIEAHQALPTLLDGTATEKDILGVCRCFRLRGLCEVLLDGTPERLQRFLAMSGQAYLHFLQRAVPAQRHTSKAAPFFDALASMDLETARQIALTGPAPFNPRREYEEDFLYVVRLMELVVTKTAGDESMRARHTALTLETDDARWNLVEALQQGDSDRFNDSLARMLHEDSARWRRLQEKGAVHEEDAATEVHGTGPGAAGRAVGVADDVRVPASPFPGPTPSIFASGLGALEGPDALVAAAPPATRRASIARRRSTVEPAAGAG
ncbi:immunity 49 family protein [Vitiosangium sp. GDMCC 1.1324]|uniref:immunity 49 family protein n=1 Tax=Vitiosangium sp. (strain GDMCC 1.1324) TaxID=2138576 RepID=UPI000D3814AD|nr:immunity 49 family protein [Vitiosangium sp. GDMCC 1.1324]PTL80677.1 hypothetical protein DAT35_29070 [Vitiosangium sp. GDMCC 1.1324]